MNHPRPIVRRTAAVDDYAVALYREVVRLLARRRRLDDAQDIAAEIAERFLAQPDGTMACFSDPRRYARVAVGHAGIAFDRRQRAQRGEGVRLVRGADGRLAPLRPHRSGNTAAFENRVDLLDTVADRSEPFADLVARDIDNEAMLERCLVGVSAADREVLLLIDGVGYTVRDLAGLIGQRRETMSRRVNRVRRQVFASEPAERSER